MNFLRGSFVGAVLFACLMLAPSTGVIAPAHDAPGSPSAMLSTGPSPSSPMFGADAWQEFQHDPMNTGVSGDSPVQGYVSWNASMAPFAFGPDAPMVGSPVVGQGNVYVPQGDTIRAFNATTGASVWSTALTPSAGTPVVDDTPLLWHGWLIVSEDQGAGFPDCATPCSSLYILNSTSGKVALDAPEGTDGWPGAAVPGSFIPLSGAEFDGDVGFAFVNFDGYFYTYTWDGTTLTAVGNTQAVRTAGARVTSTPSVAYVPGEGWGAFWIDPAHEDIEGAALSDGAALPYLPNFPVVTSGTMPVAWESDNSGSIAIANVSTSGAAQPVPIAFFGDDEAPSIDSHLVALDLSTQTALAVGTLVSPIGGLGAGLLSTPAVVPVNATSVDLLVTDVNKTLSCWDFYDNPHAGDASSLTMLWSQKLDEPADASPAIAGGSDIYAADLAGNVWDVNIGTGTVQWSTNLSEPIQSDFALGYSRLYVLGAFPGDALDGNLTALGPRAPPERYQLAATATAVSPIASGGRSLIVVQASMAPIHGTLGGGPAAGAQVNLSAAPAGTFQFPTLTLNSKGYGYDNWTSAPSSPVWYNATVSLNVWSPYNVSTSTTTVIEVSPGTGGSVSPLTLDLSPQSPGPLSGGGSQALTFTATTTGGSPVKGVTVSLHLNGLGSLSSPGPLTTGTNGVASDTFLAPATITSDSSTLLTANATGAGYSPASAAVAFLLVPPGPGGSSPPPVVWTASANLTAVDLDEGASSEIAVTFENSTVAPAQPLAGLTVGGSSGGSASGSLTSSSALTDAQGVADFQFIASSTPGAALLTFSARVGQGFASTSVSVSVSPGISPSPPTVTWSATAMPSSVAIYVGNTTVVSVIFVNTTVTPTVPLVGLEVTATASSVASGVLSSSTATTGTGGVAQFTFAASKVPGAVLLSFSAAQGKGSAQAWVSVSVFNPTSSSTPSSTTNGLYGLSDLDWLLLLLVVVLAVLLVVALARGRRRPLPPSPGVAGSEYLETPPPSPSPSTPSEAPHPWVAPPEVLAGATVVRTTPGPASEASPPPPPPTTPSPSPAPPEDTSPITVEEEPETAPPPQEDSELGSIDHDKLAEHLGAALAAAGADEGAGAPEETPSEGSAEPSPPSSEEVEGEGGSPSEPAEENSDTAEPTGGSDALSTDDKDDAGAGSPGSGPSPPAKPMMPLRRKHKPN